mgnify:CR=1 FL=1
MKPKLLSVMSCHEVPDSPEEAGEGSVGVGLGAPVPVQHQQGPGREVVLAGVQGADQLQLSCGGAAPTGTEHHPELWCDYDESEKSKMKSKSHRTLPQKQ